MRFSIWPSTEGSSWAAVREVVTHGEATGWDRAYVADHFMPDGVTADDETIDPMLEATGTIAALAAITDRIELANLVLSVTYRHPAVLAKWAATMAEISNNRFTLGIGAGWQINEHSQYGIELGPPGQRIDRFVEALDVIGSLTTQRETTSAGTYYQLDRALLEPKPARLPLLIGGKQNRMLGVVARYADEWNMWAMPPAIIERRAVLDAACERIGRDPAEIATTTQALWFVTDDPAEAERLIKSVGKAPAIAGNIAQLTEAVAAWRDAGVDEVIVPDFTFGTGAQRLELMDSIIEQIVPEFRP